MKKESRRGVALEMLLMSHKEVHHIISKNTKQPPLSVPHMMAMSFIKCHENVLLKDVANHLNITNASASTLIKKLEDKNLITKKTNKNDGRAHFLQTSKKGREMMESCKKEILKATSPMFDKLTEEEIEQFIKIFKKIIN